MLNLGDDFCSSGTELYLPASPQHICLMIHEITKGLNFFASFCLSDFDSKRAKISRLRFRAVFTDRELLGTGSHLGEWAGVAKPFFLFYCGIVYIQDYINYKLLEFDICIHYILFVTISLVIIHHHIIDPLHFFFVLPPTPCIHVCFSFVHFFVFRLYITYISSLSIYPSHFNLKLPTLLPFSPFYLFINVFKLPFINILPSNSCLELFST